MFPKFLPASVNQIEDRNAIALLQKIERQIIDQVATAYVHSARSNTTPIVLIPGFDSSVLEFRRLFPHLAAQNETWTIDPLGFGFTETISTVEPRSIRQHLLKVIQTLIAQPIVLIGASLGGAISIDFALHHPEWVRSLVLIDSVGFSGSFPVGQWLPESLLALGADWLHFRKQAALSAAPWINRSLIDTIRCSLLHQEMAGWKNAIVSFSQSGGYEELSIDQIQQPTLIIWGKRDDILGIKDATRFQSAIAGSELIWAENSGHVPHFDEPEFVAAQILKFIHSK
ncbi:alpha/beta fold hydrolase [Leptolyngbya sp. AN03gr2]|uniref:alpha/beta fold hydrolase n=1 Tax=unclassified Leptolyngbya TaxID=2650499 RepID=UPI003D318C10